MKNIYQLTKYSLIFYFIILNSLIFSMQSNQLLLDGLASQDIELIKESLNLGANVNLSFHYAKSLPFILDDKAVKNPIYVKITPLIYAIYQNNEDVIKLLLNHKDIDPNAEIIEYRFANKPGIRTLEPNYFSCALIETIKNPKIISLLIAHPKININKKDKFGATALSTAAINSDLNLVLLLLNHPNINLKLIRNNGGANYALGNASEKTIKIAKILCAAGCSKRDVEQFFWSVQFGKEFRLALDEGMNIYNNIIAHATNFNFSKLSQISKLGFTLNVKDKDGNSIMHILIKNLGSQGINYQEKLNDTKKIIVLLLYNNPNLIELKNNANEDPIEFSLAKSQLCILEFFTKLATNKEQEINPMHGCYLI